MALRLHGLLALSGLALAPPVGALPPCDEPGTISTVTAPDGGDYLAAFGEHRSYLPLGLALDPAGQVHVSDGSVIYRLESDGSATRIVGVPQTREERAANVLRDSVAALDARIGPEGLVFDRQGRLYFVDYVNRSWPDWGRKLSRIARLDPEGQVVTIAGGEYGSSGDGGPAREARFGVMTALAFDREGRLLVAGTDGIRQIDGQGVVTTLVESDGVTGLLVDDRGVVYYSQGNQVFRRSADGVIEIVAGSRVYEGPPSVKDNRSYSASEGRLATEVPLYKPWDMVIDEEGVLYIQDWGFNRIHRIRPDGVIETVAGNGLDYVARGCAAEKRAATGKRLSEHRCQDNIGNGGPALEAPIWFPFRLLLTSEGDLLVSMLNSFRGLYWGGEEFSQLRRICRVREWMVATAVEAVEEEVPANGAEGALTSLRLFPNPSNAAVTVAFELDHSATVSVRVYDELGQRVRVLAAEAERPAGSYQFVWDGLDQAGWVQASGTYFLVVSVDGTTESHKLTLLH